MSRITFVCLILIFSVCRAECKVRDIVVADSTTHVVLGNASVFSRNGNFIGVSKSDGRLPYISPDNYPITIRYMGFKETSIERDGCDTVFMQESILDLPEFVVESRRHKILHMLAYVREFSTLTTYTDTVFLFREKMIDFMLPSERKMRFKGWRRPRVLTSRSYYHFSDNQGLDSVGDRSRYHFSWADWIGMTDEMNLPMKLSDVENGTDTIFGKYSPTEVWVKNNSRVSLDINVLADTASRKWVPNLATFFRDNIDFEQFRIRFNFDNVAGNSVMPHNLSNYSFTIESDGRGHGMFMFNRYDEPFFVSTYAEVYIADKEYISVKEAKKWESIKFDPGFFTIYEPADTPDLQPAIQNLIDRVNAIDHESIRLAQIPDKRLAGRKVEKLNVGQAILKRLKGMFGIDHIGVHKKWNRNWRNFRIEKTNRNNGKSEGPEK